MTKIKMRPLHQLGHNFIDPEYLHKEDEYYFRNQQSPDRNYRHLNAEEIEILIKNQNTADDWDTLMVADHFNPHLVKQCQFYGLNRIGTLKDYFLEYQDLRLPVGLYNSTIVSCDFQDNVSVHNVNYLAHYIIGEGSMLANIDEMVTTSRAKFGNGILKKGEKESSRIWLELCNENAGRKVLPFSSMLAGDAYLWSRFRHRKVFQKALLQITENQYDNNHGYYGSTGKQVVIKNSLIIKDVNIGDNTYIKGANKLKNLTILSSPETPSQIGEGVELVNGIIGYGSKLFYGVKAVRFVMGANSQLKYGARLINSYLGDNATISCCEVLNSLIFPGHEQHHNNSFLCAATIMGQANMAAGATIGSNHNSRANDGEIIANRGFWPALCVSLKHNSRFAAFSLIAKGDYPAEIDNPFPFALLHYNDAQQQLQIMPAYWYMYNHYALTRNSWKFKDRDGRKEKIQHIEFEHLAPDTVNEMLQAMNKLEEYTAIALQKEHQDATIQTAYEYLNAPSDKLQAVNVLAYDIENSKKPVNILKPYAAYQAYQEMITLYCGLTLAEYLSTEDDPDLSSIFHKSNEIKDIAEWRNIGGQLVPEQYVQELVDAIEQSNIKSWDEIHEWYGEMSDAYSFLKAVHAIQSYKKMHRVSYCEVSVCEKLFTQSMDLLDKSHTLVYKSRQKDYQNPFRKITFEHENEMNEVVGKLEDNVYIKRHKEECEGQKKMIANALEQVTSSQKIKQER